MERGGGGGGGGAIFRSGSDSCVNKGGDNCKAKNNTLVSKHTFFGLHG